MHGATRKRLALYLRMLAMQLKTSALASLQYRLGFWSDGVLGVLWGLIGVVPLFVALEHRQDVVGWNAESLLVLTGCFVFVQGIYGALLMPALLESMERIRSGTLDYLLLRPADAMFSALTCAFSLWRLVECVAGGALVIVGLAWLGRIPSPLEVVVSAGWMLCGLIALYALGIFVLCASFRALQLQQLAYLLEATMDFARWPVSVFRGPMKALFTFIVPLAVMTSHPAASLVGLPIDASILGVIVAVGALAALARTWWLRAILNYTSASS